MPKIGDIIKAEERNSKGGNKFIWVACPDCGKERWIVLYKNKPKYNKCQSCNKKGENNPIWTGGISNTKEYKRKWYQDNKEGLRGKRRQWRKNNFVRENELSRLRYKKQKERIDKYKLLKGCSVCGYNKCAEALDFHHNGDKKFDIAKAINNMSFERIKKEMDKCEILCCRCHRELHAKLKKR